MQRRIWSRRISALTVLWPLTVLSALTACGTGTTAQPQAAPSAVPVVLAEALPADRLVFLVESGGAFVPAVVAALESPQLAVYGDGRVFRYDNHRGGYEVPVGYTRATIDPLLVQRFAAETEALGLVDEDTDPGSPPISDVEYTTIRLHGAAGPRKLIAYALDKELDETVTPAQRKERRELRALIERARTLPGDDAGTTYRPDRARVFQVDSYGAGKVPAWPGPAPASFLRPSQQHVACGTLDGSAAARAYAAARKNPGATWKVGKTRRTLAVVALLPGLVGCES